MTIPRYAELAKRALHEGIVASERAVSSGSREAAIHAIESAMRAKARRTLRMRAAVGSLAIAAAAALVFFSIHPRELARSSNTQTPPSAVAAIVVRSSGDGAQIVGGTPAGGGAEAVASGARIVALPHGHALMAFATGTNVNVDEGGDVTIVDQGPAQILSLGAGALRADVAKLKAGERFIVRTVDAEIEVHGTSFRVETVAPDPTCGDGTTTRLRVFEGIVTVRANGREVQIPAGGLWPSACAPTAAVDVVAPASPSSRIATSRPAAGASPTTGGSSEEAPAITPPVSELTNQNDLFAAAVSERRAGNLRAAVERYDAFLSRYPNAPLAESAASQRMKALRDAKDPRAISAARAYLAHYPSGFSRADAETIVASSP